MLCLIYILYRNLLYIILTIRRNNLNLLFIQFLTEIRYLSIYILALNIEDVNVKI